MKAFLFDLDGTLIDSAEDIGYALSLALREIGKEEKMPSNIKALVGGGAKALLEKVLGNEFKDEYVEVFRKHYMANPVIKTRPYEGIKEVLCKLKEKDVKLAVVSNKLEDLSKEILRRIKMDHFFDLVVGGDTFEEKKPSPIPVVETLKMLNVKPEHAIIIGDTEADIEAGKRAGIKTALALWGYVRLNSQKPDFKLKEPGDILKILECL